MERLHVALSPIVEIPLLLTRNEVTAIELFMSVYTELEKVLPILKIKFLKVHI